MRVLTLCGSIRASRDNHERIMDLARTKGSLEEFIATGKRQAGKNPSLSNSEIMAAAVMKGVLSRGGEVDYFSIKDLFPIKESQVLDFRPGCCDGEKALAYLDTLGLNEADFEDFLSRLSKADGVVLATPVYFGDRSSVANKFMQITARRNLLRDKVFGASSVGAKRNGGQETCNIFSMIEALSQNALVVGNGPPTSQYGGTVVAGNKGHAFEDAWGLQTAFGVGVKTAHVGEIQSLGREVDMPGRVRIDILVTMDTPEHFFLRYLEQLTDKVRGLVSWVDFHIHPILDKTIYRCLGCAFCPAVPGGTGMRQSCAIKDPEDCMERLRDALLLSDCAVIAGLNLLDPQPIIYRYQVLTERMRYIRRSDFELTDLLIAGLSYNQFGAKVNPIHTTKALCSFIRQNTTIHRPIEIFEHHGQFLENGEKPLLDLCHAAKRIKAGRMRVPAPESRYEAFGVAGGYK